MDTDMSISQEIREELLKGRTPTQLIQRGYASSTVYQQAKRLWKNPSFVAEQVQYNQRLIRLNHVLIGVLMDAFLGYAATGRDDETVEKVESRIYEDAVRIYRERYGEDPPV